MKLQFVPALHDGQRIPDADNPRGYYEFAPAKNLRADASRMSHAGGRTLKLVAQLLPSLPHAQEYRVILMERSIEEVLDSQQIMLERSGKAGAALSREVLDKVYEQQLAHARETLELRKTPLLRIQYAECLEDPANVAARIAGFLDLSLDLPAMPAAVDTSLYRNRRSPRK